MVYGIRIHHQHRMIIIMYKKNRINRFDIKAVSRRFINLLGIKYWNHQGIYNYEEVIL